VQKGNLLFKPLSTTDIKGLFLLPVKIIQLKISSGILLY